MAPSSKSSQLSEIRPKDVEKDDAQEYSPEFEKKTIINLGMARVAGMEKDLYRIDEHHTKELDIGARYSIASCMYFVLYVI
ncbi:hypothetical protein C0995_016417, partial [Termitomyces sp. Mi166